MEVEVREGRGRCAVAARRLHSGDVVLAQGGAVPPVPLRARWSEVCWTCLSKLRERKKLRCSGCRVAHFCGRECQKVLWKARGGHRHECKNKVLVCADKGKGRVVDENHVLAQRVRSDPDALKAVLGLEPGPGVSGRDEVETRFDNNNFGVVDDLYVVVAAGVYPVGAMLNHSCKPNCVLSYRFVKGQVEQVITFVGERPAELGEELTHSYCDGMLPTWERQAHLGAVYGFRCRCSLCELEDQAGEMRRAQRLQSVGEALEAAMCAGDNLAAARWSGELLDVYRESPSMPGNELHPLFGLQYFTLGDLCALNGEEDAAARWHARALEILRAVFGSENRLVKMLLPKGKRATAGGGPEEDGAAQVLTPTKLKFSDNSNKMGGGAVKNKASAIKAKVAASARKRKELAAERKQAQPPKAAKLVEEQMALVDDLVECGKHKEAREFLKQVDQDVPDSREVGLFWLKLVELEKALGNRYRTCSVFARALQHCADREVLDACARFLTTELFEGMPQQASHTVEELLEQDTEPEQQQQDKEEKDDLGSYLQFQPNTTAKKSKRRGLASGAKRVPVAPGSCMSSKSKRPRFDKGDSATGSVVKVAAVRVRGERSQSQLGSALGMTPVRRSARLGGADEEEDVSSILKKTGYTYAPNDALVEQQEELL
ncbi:Histone-lysine N-methyltransferase Smyd1 (CD8b-opposite) (SET and MYND domain-containing protein 1) (Zinc finger protein BOP) (m-BOP) [Durusdinium trenchii]|uniref:Histone-lysine N-methyltransferase Smyd1 (CD8b-opposite) (SET and MYND domain-containing protein 1) (Zinc finger protein BOP) (M-BOP) n=1 Tax=Durusdinium trenchii TaxID=1381693 RepID=A0ABP0PSK1_9DINO